MLLVREVYSDWSLERRGTIQIRRADRAGAAPPAADTETMAKRYRVAGKILLSRLRTFLAFPEWFYLNLPVNTLTEPRPTPGGLATQFSSVGHYDLADDQAMIVTVPAAGHRVAPYQGIQLGSMWYISLDYINHQTSLTADQARVDRDGMLRFVISEQDPGLVELAGAHRAQPRLRAAPLAAADPGAHRGRRPVGRGAAGQRTAGPAALLRAGPLPGRGVRGPDRRPAGRGGREDARLMLLAGKVVVVCGVGPGLGRAIAVQSARAGADVVLAARTASRLDEVAKEVAALGRRTLAVPTDITDDAEAAALADAAVAEFGQVDTLVHNAFAIPPLIGLAEVDLDAIRAAVDTNVIAALRMARLFTPALAASQGSVVMINSAVLRHSRLPYGGYKIAKSGLLALAQSLATELGPRGIRVNSVAPGWIWADVLKWYFGYLAEQRGVTRR